MVYNHVDCEKGIDLDTPMFEGYKYFWHCKCCGAKFWPNGEVLE